MASRKERIKFNLRRLKGFISTLLSSKKATVGIGIIIFYAIMALGAPLIAPHHPVLDFYVGGRFAVPIWYETLTGDPQSHNMLLLTGEQQDFNTPQSLKEWKILTQSKDIDIQYVSTLGHPHPGCLAITYRRDYTITSIKPTEVTVTLYKNFSYPYKKPPQRFIYYIKMFIKGTTEHQIDKLKTTLDVPVQIKVFIERHENETSKTYDLLWYLYQFKSEEPIPREAESPTDEWVPTFPENLDSNYIRGYLIVNGTQKGVKLTNEIFTKPSNYTIGIELTFIDYNKRKNVETTVLIDNLNFKIYGTAYGLLGTDHYGRDVFSQLVYGSQLSLLIGLLSATLSVVLGLIIGMISAYAGKIVDQILMRFTDALLVIPSLPLLLVLVAVMGPTIWNLILILGFLGWMGFARTVRSQVLSLKERPFVEAAKAVGAGTFHIIFRHILPNVISLAYIALATSVPSAIISEAALSWLGFYDPTVMTWGRMLHDSQQPGGIEKWWWIVPPGLCIALVSLSFILIGQAMDEILNPKLRKRY